MQRSEKDIRAIRDSISFIGRLSDNLVRVGPISLGLDGVLSWIPGLGEVYSALAGGFILFQGYRAGVPASVLISAGLILGVRTVATVIPIAGSAFADLFTAHKWAAAMVVRAIDQQMGWIAQSADRTQGSARWSQGRAGA